MKVVAGFTYAWFVWKISETNISSATGIASINLNTNSFMLYDGVTNAFDRGQNMLAYQVVGVTTEGETTTETPIDGCSGYIQSVAYLDVY